MRPDSTRRWPTGSPSTEEWTTAQTRGGRRRRGTSSPQRPRSQTTTAGRRGSSGGARPWRWLSTGRTQGNNRTRGTKVGANKAAISIVFFSISGADGKKGVKISAAVVRFRFGNSEPACPIVEGREVGGFFHLVKCCVRGVVPAISTVATP